MKNERRKCPLRVQEPRMKNERRKCPLRVQEPRMKNERRKCPLRVQEPRIKVLPFGARQCALCIINVPAPGSGLTNSG